MNDNGAIVGTYGTTASNTHSYLRQADGTFTLLDAPDAQSAGDTFAVEINASGVIVGYYVDAQQTFHGFVYE